MFGIRTWITSEIKLSFIILLNLKLKWKSQNTFIFFHILITFFAILICFTFKRLKLMIFFRNSRDRSSSPPRKQDKTDRRKSPHGKKSPIKRERSIKREKSPVGRNRSKDRTSAPRDRSPVGKKRSRDRSPGQGLVCFYFKRAATLY